MQCCGSEQLFLKFEFAQIFFPDSDTVPVCFGFGIANAEKKSTVRYGKCANDLKVVYNSISDPDPHWIRIRMASWIRIRIRNADSDPGGVESTKTEGKKGAKRQKIHHKKLN
jgi:hypothetical protein